MTISGQCPVGTLKTPNLNCGADLDMFLGALWRYQATTEVFVITQWVPKSFALKFFRGGYTKLARPLKSHLRVGASRKQVVLFFGGLANDRILPQGVF